ncbi:hypothetical protein PIROE2DRAFT_57748 [Piromyces sp. E2]|nr:hypothetical protein PIROE2DRAFT_57748 [Piromyces sp. E2]|eukprot:OUM68986.1 hypothetical protein PIROE2DRAFT_57748 [Piromyces sp. E2]
MTKKGNQEIETVNEKETENDTSNKNIDDQPNKLPYSVIAAYDGLFLNKNDMDVIYSELKSLKANIKRDNMDNIKTVTLYMKECENNKNNSDNLETLNIDNDNLEEVLMANRYIKSGIFDSILPPKEENINLSLNSINNNQTYVFSHPQENIYVDYNKTVLPPVVFEELEHGILAEEWPNWVQEQENILIKKREEEEAAIELEKKKKEEEMIKEKERLEEELARQKLKETQENIINCTYTL